MRSFLGDLLHQTTSVLLVFVSFTVGATVSSVLSSTAASSQPESSTNPVAIRLAMEPGTYFIVPIGKTLRVHREGACTLLLRFLEDPGPTKNLRVQDADFFADAGDYVALPQQGNQKPCDLDATLYPAAAMPPMHVMHGRNAP